MKFNCQYMAGRLILGDLTFGWLTGSKPHMHGLTSCNNSRTQFYTMSYTIVATPFQLMYIKVCLESACLAMYPSVS